MADFLLYMKNEKRDLKMNLISIHPYHMTIKIYKFSVLVRLKNAFEDKTGISG